MTQADPIALSLAALAATLSEPRRAQRFLDLTGLSVEELRARAANPAILTGLLAFLEAHEPDLIDVAAELGVKPDDLVAARRAIQKD